MSFSNKAAPVTPPIADVNLWVSASATSSKVIALPTACKYAIVTLQADGADFYVAISPSSSATVDQTDVTTEAGSPNAFTAATSPAGCIKLADGAQVDIDMSLISDPRTLYLVVKASATGGYLRIWRSSGPVKVA